jgi:Domain of unknown function (DUF1905)
MALRYLDLRMAKHRLSMERRGPFVSKLLRYPGKGGWTFAPIPRKLPLPVTRPWGRTPVRAVVDGILWETSIWRDTKTNGHLGGTGRIRGRKRSGDAVTVEFAFDPEEVD